jgi:hypothetical protein
MAAGQRAGDAARQRRAGRDRRLRYFALSQAEGCRRVASLWKAAILKLDTICGT